MLKLNYNILNNVVKNTDANLLKLLVSGVCFQLCVSNRIIEFENVLFMQN